MGLRINHNTSSINTHRNLQANDKALSDTLEKLSSGLKINRAADGPAALVISEQMRAQIAGLHQAIDNSETAVSMVQTTEANLSEVSVLLTDIRQLAIHAANEGANDEFMLLADQREIDNALTTIDRIAAQAQFGNRKLLDGSNGASGVTTGNKLEFVNAGLKTMDSSSSGFRVRVTQEATRANAAGTVLLTDEAISAGETLTVIENGRKATYTTNADDNVDTAISNLMAEVRRNELNVNVVKNDEGFIGIQHKDYGTGFEFQFSSSTAGVMSQQAGQIEGSQKGLDIKGTINSETAVGKGQILTGITGSLGVDGLQVRYSGNTAEAQAANEEAGVEPEVDDDGNEYAGTLVGEVYVSQNSLNFQVGANRGQTVGISLASTKSDVLARGTQNKSGFESLMDINVQGFQGAQDTLLLVDEAIDQITSKRGELGAFQKNTLESGLSNLRVATENLTSSESVIRDTDMAAEMAEYTKNQIMLESANAMLAQSNQSPQTVLRLLT
ncbi:MAG: flagellin [Proteobacteria bacterium]|nr:flagellin [Pseudomonadota bacterium]